MLYISNASCYLTIKHGSLLSTNNDLFTAKLQEMIMLSEKEILTKIKDIYDYCQILTREIRFSKRVSNGWCELVSSGHADRSTKDLEKEKAYQLLMLQYLTNSYANKHGATIQDIKAISYCFPIPIILQKTIDRYLPRFASEMEMTKLLEEEDGPLSIFTNACNYTFSCTIWKKLLKKGVIPPYGYCNATNSFYLIGLSTIIRHKYDDNYARILIANCLDRLINDVLGNNAANVRKAEICHIMMAAYLCGFIDDIGNICTIIKTNYNIDIDKGQANRIVTRYWQIICKETGIAKFEKGTKSMRKHQIDQMKSRLCKYIENGNDNLIESAIKDTKCYRYYIILKELKNQIQKI